VSLDSVLNAIAGARTLKDFVRNGDEVGLCRVKKPVPRKDKAGVAAQTQPDFRV
jgi:hypothetical protein